MENPINYVPEKYRWIVYLVLFIHPYITRAIYGMMTHGGLRAIAFSIWFGTNSRPGQNQTENKTENKDMTKKLTVLGILIAVAGLIVVGCVTSKVAQVAPDGSTNFVTVVNSANLAIDCDGLRLVGTPALTYALQQDPGVRPIVVNIQTALNGALKGADTNVISTIEGFLGKNQSLDNQLTPLIQAASDLRGQLIAKYGSTVAGQISLAILQTDLDIVNSALLATTK